MPELAPTTHEAAFGCRSERQLRSQLLVESTEGAAQFQVVDSSAGEDQADFFTGNLAEEVVEGGD